MNRRQMLIGTACAGVAGGIPAVASVFPQGVATKRPFEMFTVDGHDIFPLFNFTGEFWQKIGTFPMFREGDDLIVYGHTVVARYERINPNAEDRTLRDEAKAAFAAALRKGVMPITRYEGDTMPMDGEIVRFKRAPKCY